MKLFIQIPCYNEADCIALTLSELPREVEGFESVHWLIIDDGSTDHTSEAALAAGADYVVSHRRNKGLAKAFMTGIWACLDHGADVIVNTDADNQYNAEDIPLLVKPILTQKADMVIGERPIGTTAHFSLMKKMLQRVGSWVVRVASNTKVPDAPSGFRAISRATAEHLNVFSSYTYTLETIIQAGRMDMSIVSVPVRTNRDLRPSRLVSSISKYVTRSIFTIIRIFVIYRPFQFFGVLGGVFLTLGVLLVLRFLTFYLSGSGDGYIQSLIIASILIGIGFQSILFAFIADLQAANRSLLQDIRRRQITANQGASSRGFI